MRSPTSRTRLRQQPLWVRVERNRLKLALFVVLFLLACVLAAEVAVVIPMYGLVLLMLRSPELSEGLLRAIPRAAVWVGAGAIVVAALYVAVTLARPLRRMLPRIGAEPAARGELMATKGALKDIALASGLGVAPELYTVDSGSINAFIAGRGTERPVCVVTDGLVEHFDAEEQRAVFANLIARLRSGDVAWATAVSALMNPLWMLRNRDMLAGENPMFVAGDPSGSATYMSSRSAEGGGFVIWAFLTYVLAVIVTELVAFGMRRTHLRASEVADAEGMLLLKDPGAMLRALHKAIEADNRVRVAVPMYAGLFYIWAGDDLADEDDPEWHRLDRLREVVGIDGVMDAAEDERTDREQQEIVARLSPPEPPSLEERAKG